jgi:hypothetical protein
MKSKIAIVLGLTLIAPLVAACGGGAPRAGIDPNTFVTPLTLEPPPIYALLGFRRDLELSSEQVAALDSIAQAAQEEIRPLVRELQDHGRERPRQPGTIDVGTAGQPVLEEIREKQRRTVEAVAEVLSEQQRETVCRLFDRSRTGSRAQPRGSAGAAHDDAQSRGMPVPVGWHWCSGSGAVTEAEAVTEG